MPGSTGDTARFCLGAWSGAGIGDLSAVLSLQAQAQGTPAALSPWAEGLHEEGEILARHCRGLQTGEQRGW